MPDRDRRCYPSRIGRPRSTKFHFPAKFHNQEMAMSKVLILYYSTYGHVEKLAAAVAAGAREAGATVDIKRVPETAPPEAAKTAHFKLDQIAPVAKVEDLADYDAIIIGGPTRVDRSA